MGDPELGRLRQPLSILDLRRGPLKSLQQYFGPFEGSAAQVEPENHISFVRVGIGKAFSQAQLIFGDVPAASPALRSTADSGFDCMVHLVSVLRLGRPADLASFESTRPTGVRI